MIEQHADRAFALRLGRLRRHQKWVLAGGLLCGLAGFVISHFQTKVYRATTYVLVSESKTATPSDAPGTREILLSYTPLSWQGGLLLTYLPFIDNDALVSEAISKFHLDRAPFRLTPQRFREGRYLDVLNPKSTRLLEIQVEFPDARLAADIANYLAQRATEFNAQLNASDTVAAQRVLKQQLDTAASRLEEIESTRLKLRRKARIENKEQQLSILLDRKKQLSVQIEDLRLSLARTESRAKFLEGAQSSQAARDQLVTSAADAQAQRAGLQAATAALAQTNSEIDPLLVDVTDTRSEIEKVDRDYALAREAWESASHDFRNALAAVSSKSVDLKLLAPALTPENPVRPRILLNTLLSTLLGLILLGGAALGRESFRELQPVAIHYVSEEESANAHRP